MTLATASSRVDNIRRSLVGLKMPRALEIAGGHVDER